VRRRRLTHGPGVRGRTIDARAEGLVVSSHPPLEDMRVCVVCIPARGRSKLTSTCAASGHCCSSAGKHASVSTSTHTPSQLSARRPAHSRPPSTARRRSSRRRLRRHPDICLLTAGAHSALCTTGEGCRVSIIYEGQRRYDEDPRPTPRTEYVAQLNRAQRTQTHTQHRDGTHQPTHAHRTD